MEIRKAAEAVSICTRISSNTQPTLLKITSVERQAAMKLLASLLLVSPTSMSMEGLSVEPKLTKQ